MIADGNAYQKNKQKNIQIALLFILQFELLALRYWFQIS